MARKTYRPKADAEGLAVTFPTSDGYVDIGKNDWPYSTENAEEQAYLDSLEQATDRPEPKSRQADDEKGAS